jgi:hypothetical protein
MDAIKRSCLRRIKFNWLRTRKKEWGWERTKDDNSHCSEWEIEQECPRTSSINRCVEKREWGIHFREGERDTEEVNLRQTGCVETICLEVQSNVLDERCDVCLRLQENWEFEEA